VGRRRLPPRGRRGRLLAWFDSQGLATLLFLALGVPCAVAAVDIAVENARLGADAPVAEAVVVEVHRERGRAADTYVVVEFTTVSGRPVRAELYDVDLESLPHTGDRLRASGWKSRAPRFTRASPDRSAPARKAFGLFG
jgi:hypothetical protein